MLNEKAHGEELPELGSAGVILNGRYLSPPEDKDGKLWVRSNVLIQADAQRLYQLWRDIESIPAWQEAVVSVVRTGEKTSHWVMRAGDKKIELDTEILADEPGKRIAWRSIAGEAAGEVIFEPAPGGRGTIVTVLQEFRMNKMASAWEAITGRSPKQSVIENLRHFKAWAETGEIPRTQGQPHGPRGFAGGAKKVLYGENIPIPSGTRKVS